MGSANDYWGYPMIKNWSRFLAYDKNVVHQKESLAYVQGGAPPSYKWIYQPINYRYITYKPKLLDL